MPDIEYQEYGACVSFTARNDVSEKWLYENTQWEPWQWNGPSLMVDVRMSEVIKEGAENAGFTIA